MSFDEETFRVCKSDFLFPVKALSKVFRGKFMELFTDAFNQGKLIFPGKTASFGTSQGFRELVKRLWEKPWVVYSKKPFSGPEAVLGYIARYTHRVAISNHRILKCENGKVTFAYRNRKKNRTEEETLDAVEFIRRFLQHVVPKNFMRIRHFGLFANRKKTKNINRCRRLLGVKGDMIKPEGKSIADLMLELTGKDIRTCPICKKGVMKPMLVIPKFTGQGSHEILKPHVDKGLPFM